jgi:uncharacterized protein
MVNSLRILAWFGLIISCATVSVSQKKDYPVTPVPFTSVKLNDSFWLPRVRTNHSVTIPASFERCETTGRVRNFEMAAARSGAFCTVYPFDDTDIYKTIEGASFSLNTTPDKKLEAYIDSLIAKVAAAQEPDGYLYTARTINPAAAHKWSGKERWEKERDNSHELYNAGHLYEAAAAHFQATGKRNLLDIALKNADLVCNVFGNEGLHVAPGHEVIEMGLVKLYRITGKEDYLRTAKFFIDERGHYKGYDSTNGDVWKNGAYWQDHIPVVQQDEAIGHAVRAGYLYAGMADVAALTGDQQYLTALDKIWNNMVGKKFYVQGGVGAVGHGERFGGNYELPNSTAYNETCAAIANVYWNQRMFQLYGDAKYVDVLERSLYNGLLSGVGMDGKSFFYTNAMEIRNSFKHSDMEGTRSGWFTCSCCPTNIVRLIPSVPGYMYATRGDRLYINLFASSSSNFSVNKKEVSVIQENNYPWSGDLTFRIDPKSATKMDVLIRIPGWAGDDAVPSDLYSFASRLDSMVKISVNGTLQTGYKIEKGYAVLSRMWRKGDVVTVVLPMEVREIVSNSKLDNNINRFALQRGPLVYCAEWPDNFGMTSNLVIPSFATFTTVFKPSLLNGVVVIETEAMAVTANQTGTMVLTKPQPFTAIPYYAWAHRGPGEMMIWLPQKVSTVELNSK